MKALDIFLSQVFLSLENFLQKATTLNIFEALIFNYKIKINSVEHCSPQFLGFVVDLCNELQLVLRENVIEAIDKPEELEKNGSTFCELESANPDFSEFNENLPSDQGLCDKNLWKPREQESGYQTVNNTRNVDNVELPTEERESSEKQIINTCGYCNRKYCSDESFSKHICRSSSTLPEDKIEEEFVDDPDSRILNRSAQIQRVSEPDHEQPVYVCAVCFYSYSQREQFDQHSHKDNSQEEVELVTDQSWLAGHRKFVCGVCREVYRSLARISYHTANCRAGPYLCELCPHQALTKQLLNRHKKKHHKGVESFFCQMCGLGFKLRSSLQKHLVNRHETDRPHFACDADGCGLIFAKKIQLTNHRIEKHGIERKFLCQVCGHKFMTQDSLSCHLECHSANRRFQCRLCAKLFLTKEKLTFHVRTHTGEKPFTCIVAGCQKSFVSKSKLTEHLERHRGLKRHKCPYCGKQYANKPDLRTHLRKIHPAEEGESRSASLTMIERQSEEQVVQHANTSTDLFPSQLVVQVEAPPPPATGQLFNNVQFFPDSVQLIRTVSTPQNMVIASYETIVGI